MSDELKTPLKVAKVRNYHMVGNSHGKHIFNVECSDEGTLAAVVHRVNCHDKLVEALEDCIAELEASRGGHVKSVVAAKAALKPAKGGGHE